ncbi:MAG: lipase, partial [Maritimibacter sp.]
MMNPELNGFLDRWQQEWASLAPGASLADRRAHFEVSAANMRLPTPDGVNTGAEYWVESPAGPVRLRAFRPSAGGK